MNKSKNNMNSVDKNIILDKVNMNRSESKNKVTKV